MPADEEGSPEPVSIFLIKSPTFNHKNLIFQQKRRKLREEPLFLHWTPTPEAGPSAVAPMSTPEPTPPPFMGIEEARVLAPPRLDIPKIKIPKRASRPERRSKTKAIELTSRALAPSTSQKSLKRKRGDDARVESEGEMEQDRVTPPPAIKPKRGRPRKESK